MSGSGPVLEIGFGPTTADLCPFRPPEKRVNFALIQQLTKTHILCFDPPLTKINYSAVLFYCKGNTPVQQFANF